MALSFMPGPFFRWGTAVLCPAWRSTQPALCRRRFLCQPERTLTPLATRSGKGRGLIPLPSMKPLHVAELFAIVGLTLRSISLIARRSLRRRRRHLVRARPIQTRHGNIQQPEIHGQLRPVMDQVVEHHAADARHPWHLENLLSTCQKRPILHHFLIAYATERGAGLRDILLKDLQQLLAVVCLRRLVGRSVHRSIIQLLGPNRHCCPTW